MGENFNKISYISVMIDESFIGEIDLELVVYTGT